MLVNKKFVLFTGVALALGVSSCRKFMDVNTNPNISQTATVQTLLPAAELYIGSSVGVDLQVIGSIWAQYWTQSPVGTQYEQFEKYTPSRDAFSSAWTNLYAGAENFYQLSNLADTQNKTQYQAIAVLMQAYTFQLIADGWGDAPFKQALKGQYSSGHLITPKYDSQMVVYNGILADIDSANKLINTADPVHPGADDLIYGGDMSKWKKFANTLKLKVILRTASIDPVGAQAKVAALYASVPKPVFIGEGDEAKIAYGSSSANRNPLYSEESSTKLGGIQNLAASKTCIDAMNGNSDPRVRIFYQSGSAGFSGIAQSAYNVPVTAGSYAIPGIYVAGDMSNANSGNAPVNLLSSWESLFLQAEVVARGWAVTGSSDNALFYQGIKASFDYPFYYNALVATYTPTTGSAYNDYVSAGGPWTSYPTAGTLAAKLSFIITQKWFAMCGNQGFEAWTELRRTGYPNFLVHPVNSLIGTDRPRRCLYPTSENPPALLPVNAGVWWNSPSVVW